MHLVKTVAFANRHYLGDPLNAAYVFSEYEVDELLVLDIDASEQSRSIPFQFIEYLAQFTSVPLTVGGGITSLDEISKILSMGVEKVALSSVLKVNFSFLNDAVSRFGSSTISVILNCANNPHGNSLACFGRPDSGSLSFPIEQLALACESAGAGELVLNSVDRDGTLQGYQNDILKRLNENLGIPLVALGGCGSFKHISSILSQTPLSGVAAGSLFVFAPETKQILLNYPDISFSLHSELCRIKESSGL